MKLVKIEDVRVGQIWNAVATHNETCKTKCVTIAVMGLINDYPVTFKCEVFGKKLNKDYTSDNYSIEPCKNGLIGFLGITHEIKDNRLVEIPRTELKVDDVVKFNDGTQRQYVIIEEKKEYSSIFENNKRYKCMHEKYGDRELFDFEFKKIGILGVTHEFVNDCEARND